MGIIRTQVRIHFEIEVETHGQLLEIVEQTQWLPLTNNNLPIKL